MSGSVRPARPTWRRSGIPATVLAQVPVEVDQPVRAGAALSSGPLGVREPGNHSCREAQLG